MRFLFITVAVCLCGCGAASDSIVTLFTNRPEIVAYSETFNSAQNAYRLEIQYQENTPAALSARRGEADLIIMENLAGRTSARGFRSLDGIFGKDGLDQKSFYSALLAVGRYEKRQTLIPVSFNLPILMFDAWASGSESLQFMINLDDLPELASQKNRKTGAGYTSMGFAPRWNPDFLVQTALMRGAAFLEGSNAILSWNDSSLRQTIAYLRNWADTYNGGPGAEIAYSEKYLYDPPYRQVSLGRVKYAFMTIADFFLLPENRRMSLDFRWLAHEKKIFAHERILFAGIPVGSKNPDGAEAFLKWLFSADTQRSLLELSRRKTPQVFGIASGFSSLRQINEEEFPRLYPHLAGHIPPGDILVFPHPLPYTWNRMKPQVLIPWMLRQLAADPSTENLDTQLHGWLQQQTY
jgi:ABC-type glycerol-3-phosphate transport system substrate-binding protein